MEILGIDIGGTGIKGAIVNTKNGEMVSERIRYETPAGAKPDDVLDVVKKLIDDLNYSGPVGCGFPAVVHDGVVRTASNIDKSWIDININKFLGDGTGLNFKVVNDVDATGIAEMTLGAGKSLKGTVVVVSFGTGIGSAVFRERVLIPNTELGFLRMKNGKIAEHYTSNLVRKKEDLSYKKFAKRVTKYLNMVTFLFSPEVIIFGGGVSKKWHKFGDRLEVNTNVMPAGLKNHAGLIGAASIFKL